MPIVDRDLHIVAAVLDESEHPLLLADRSGRVLYGNQRTREKLGFLGPWDTVATGAAPEDLGPNLDGALLALGSGESSKGFEFQYAGARLHGSVRLLPKLDWLIIRLYPNTKEQKQSDLDPLGQQQNGMATSSVQNPTLHAAQLQKTASEEKDTICEPLGDGLCFLASTPEMMKLRKQALRISSVDVPVLITGESGTGKEVVARMVHQHRQEPGPFIKVNCAALPTELLESELFGYEQGAFTGAVRAKPGKFELANHGTIFLDEIGEMSSHLQSKLLHVLQDGQFSRLGSRHVIHVRVRIIAATNVNVQEALQQGRFREDLYYRLNVVPFHLPPLRNRVAEIPMLIRLFFDRYSLEFKKELASPGFELMEAARRYSWPGNVRELENFVKRYVVMANEEESLHELLEMTASRERKDGATANANKSAQPLKTLVRGLKDEAEMQAIADALKRTNWRRKETARILGISYKALLYKMRQFGFSHASSNGSSQYSNSTVFEEMGVRVQG